MSQLLRAGLVSEVVVALFLIFIAEADLVAQEIDLPWVRVEAGTFEMGCVPDDPFCLEVELPRHEVALSAFELMETELTVSQYGLFIEATGRTLPPTPDFSQVCRNDGSCTFVGCKFDHKKQTAIPYKPKGEGQG